MRYMMHITIARRALRTFSARRKAQLLRLLGDELLIVGETTRAVRVKVYLRDKEGPFPRPALQMTIRGNHDQIERQFKAALVGIP